MESKVEPSWELSAVEIEESVKVLHVDDETSFLEVAKQCLELQRGFQVETASTVEEALKKLQRKKYDAIVSDYQMPGKDGIQFLKELRNMGNMTPFIIFTGRGREEVAVQALNLGADRYLNKAGDPEAVYSELAHSIRSIVKAKSAEEELAKREMRYRSLVENAGVGILTVNPEGNFTFVNEGICSIIGYSENEILGKPFISFVHPNDKERVLQRFFDMLQSKKKAGFEFRAIHKDGQTLNLYASPTLFTYKDEIIGSHAIIIDITERKKKEKELIRLSNAVKASIDGIIVGDLEAKIIDVNEAILKMYGTEDKGELVGKSAFDFIAPEHQERAISSLKETLEKGHSRNREYQILTKDKGKVLVEMNSSIVKNIEGKPMGFVSIIRDITERKKTEEELVKSEEKYRNLVELAPDSIMTFNLKGVVTSANTASTRLSGYSKDELVGKHFSKIGPVRARDVPKYVKMLYSTLRGKVPEPFEGIWLDKNGAEHLGEVRCSLFRVNGKIAGIQAIMREMTEHRHTEAALLDAKEKWVSLTENTDDIIIVVDNKGVIQHVNKTVPPYTPDETIGKTVYEYVPSGQRDVLSKSLRKVFKTGQPDSYEVSLNIPRIGTTWFTTKVVPIKHEGKTVEVILISTDITERKKVGEALQESEERYRSIFNNAPDLIVTVDEKGIVTSCNSAVGKGTGYSKDEVIGKHFLNIPLTRGIDAAHAQNLFRSIMEEKLSEPIEIEWFLEDGTPRLSEIRMNLMKREGKVVGFTAIARDITERKKAEMKLKQTLEKLHVVGGLTRHDVRNKLSAIIGNVYLAKQTLPRDHKALQHLGEVETAVRLTEGILDFASIYEKLGIEELIYIDVEKSLKEVVTLFPDLQGIKVTNDCHGLTVLADSLLRQLVYNLIDNSLKHGEKVTQIRVRYEETGKDKLKLVYEDDGVGIPKGEKEKIFQEGYGKGTGYGLFLIRKMCEFYGWTVKESGTEGKGAQFTITVPRTYRDGKPSYKILK